MNGTEAARAVLRANDRGGYTVPTAKLYPFQWNWDSAFVAMGWSTFDEEAAWREVESLLVGQWDDGMIPHIVFHAPADTYFPGPEVWGAKHRVPTSGITQPPVLASAVRRLWARGAEARAAAIYPKLLANHRWWRRARDPENTGLVSILHPWESGMDNSPAWDRAMARVPTETTTKIVRRDTGHVDPTHRPLQIDYQRFIHIVDTLRDCGWEPARMWAKAPLKIADIATNSILARAEADLLALASRFGTPAEAAEIAARAEALRAGLARSWRPALGLYASSDRIDRTPIDVPTSAGFLPLYGGVAAHAAELGATLDRWAAKVRVLVPSTPPDWPGFEAKRYWRGPVWAVVNWMIAGGFAAAGDQARATRIRRDTRDAIAQSGFCENFDPLDGSGAGGGAFSWTAAIDLLLGEAA
jgi:glycogen debranching enzyme